MNQEELKEFNNEWEKSNDWGGGKFGCLEEINDEYCEFIPNKDGTIDFINNLLKSRQEKMIKEFRSKQLWTDYETIPSDFMNGFNQGLDKGIEIIKNEKTK